MTFGYPAIALLLLLALPLGVWALVRLERSRRAALHGFGQASLLARASAMQPERLRSLRHGMRVLALSLGLLALARPQFGERPASLVHTGRDVLVLLDLSRSMNAADVEAPALRSEPALRVAKGQTLGADPGKLSRLDAAKLATVEVLAASPGDRVGLVVFGGSAFLQLPLTADHAAFRRFLDAATTDDLADPATDLSRALATAATTFDHEGERGYQSVLLLSDGESREADLAPAIARLRSGGVPVFAIGFGTGGGAPIPADSAHTSEKWHRDHIGRIVQSRLEERDLIRAAQETNGHYLRWTPGAGPTVGTELARLEKRTMSSRTSPERADRFQWPLGLAIILLALDPLTLRAGVSILILLVACSPALRQTRRAERLYEAGQFRESREAFQQALDAGGDPALHFAIGNSLYRMRRYEDAAKSFREAAAVPRLRQRSYYNLGNAFVRISEESSDKDESLRQAIAAYEQALRLEPADTAAKWNLELALKRRGDDRESGGTSGRGRSADYGRGDMNVPGYEGNPEAAVGAMAGGGYGAGEGESAEELSEAQARQLLEALEREQLTSHQGRPAGRSGSGQLDW